MKLIQGGQEPATKDDLRHLQLTMLAGFQLCMEELQAVMAIVGNPTESVSKEQLEQLIIAQRDYFDRQMKIACQQVLERETRENCD